MNIPSGKLNSRGLSLMELMVAVTIMGIVSVGLMTFLDNSIASQNAVSFKAEADALTNEIRSTLGSTTACVNTFTSATPSALVVDTAMASSRTQIRDKAGTAVYVAGTNYGDRMLTLTTLSMGQYQDVVSTEGLAKLTIVYTATRRTLGPSTLAREIPIVTQKSGTTLVNCYSKAAGSDSLWMAIGSTSVTAIYFAAGDVGVGTPTPQSRFDMYDRQTETAGTTYSVRNRVEVAPASISSANHYNQYNLTETLAGGPSLTTNLFGLYNQVSHNSAAVNLRQAMGSYDIVDNVGTGSLSYAYGSMGIARNLSTGTAYSLVGAQGTAQNSGTGGVTQLLGVYGSANNSSTGTVPTGYGTYGIANNSSSGTMTSAFGAYGLVYNYGAMTSAYGGYMNISTLSAGATLTNAYGLMIDVNQTAGTIANGYGVYIQDIEGTLQYGMYQAASTDHNYFAGAVGFGTTAPAARIESYGAGMGLYLNQVAAADLYIRYHVPGVRWWTIGPKANGDFWFTNDSTHSTAAPFVIRSAGNVGIGTTTPAYPLDVAGIVRGGSFLSTSDRNEKDLIDTAPGLELIKELRGVTFVWKKDRKPFLGVIAQEVEQVLPELVATDESGKKSVFYEGLFAPVIESIKELKVMCEMSDAQSKELAARVQNAERRIASLESQVTELRRDLAILRSENEKRFLQIEKKKAAK